jgi:hypothetical protein
MATNQINYGENVTGSTIDLNDLSSSGVGWNDLLSTTVTTGTGGYTLGTGGYTNGYTYTSVGTSASPWITVNDGTSTLSVSGDADVTGDIKIKGRSLAEFMDSVEQRLNMLRPNPRLEAEWDQLRELGEQYRALEKQLLEKEQMWQTLKR